MQQNEYSDIPKDCCIWYQYIYSRCNQEMQLNYWNKVVFGVNIYSRCNDFLLPISYKKKRKFVILYSIKKNIL